MKNRKAFTLVELLVVIAIIAILAVAGVVGYTVFISKAHKSNAVRDMSDIQTLIIAEDTSNVSFVIADGTITFSGLYLKEGAIVTDPTDATAIGTEGANDDVAYGKAFKYVITNASDPELAALASKLSYTASEHKITYTSDESSADWNIADNTIE